MDRLRLLTNVRTSLLGYIMVTYVFFNPTDSESVQLAQDNIDMTLASNEVVLINFYAEWCRFSNILMPVFDEAAGKVQEKFPEAGKVVMGKVDCDKENSIASRFHITKYPTLKLIRNGQPAKREYRGQRSTEAFVEFIEKQLEDPVKEFFDLAELMAIPNKRVLIGYFDRRDQPEYSIFRRVASNLKEDCQFFAGFGGASQTMHPPGQPLVVFRPDQDRSNDLDQTYNGSLANFDELHIWASELCVPLVREITFENAEELTEEGLPFLILFHAPDDKESIKRYNEIVVTDLLGEKQNINFLTADGHKFAHPLHHLGKSISDLPLIAIDSFRHMYLFPDYRQIEISGKLKEFIGDLYSGKLHREFHYGPDDDTQAPSEAGKLPTQPPSSTFRKLAPSKNRYTLLKDEL